MSHVTHTNAHSAGPEILLAPLAGSAVAAAPAAAATVAVAVAAATVAAATAAVAAAGGNEFTALYSKLTTCRQSDKEVLSLNLALFLFLSISLSHTHTPALSLLLCRFLSHSVSRVCVWVRARVLILRASACVFVVGRVSDSGCC